MCEERQKTWPLKRYTCRCRYWETSEADLSHEWNRRLSIKLSLVALGLLVVLASVVSWLNRR